MTTCKYLVIKEGMMYCGRWKYGPSLEINDETCSRCPILKLEQGYLCEFLDFGIRKIHDHPRIGSIIGNQIVEVAMACIKLGKNIQDLKECENCPDRASEFLSKQVLSETESLLNRCGFSGPLQEFKDAFNRFINGDTKGSITASSSSFESTMKAVLAKEGVPLSGNETASQLIPLLEGQKYFLPFLQSMINAFKSIMQGLATIRNNVSLAHGQGLTITQIENSYAEFALHLSGSFNLFIVKRYLERNPPKP